MAHAIRRFIEQQRLEIFWSTTLAQVYPELAQLADAGHLTYREDPQGARQRREYSLTDKGEQALSRARLAVRLYRPGARRAVAVKPGFEPALGSIAVRPR